jgi:hypothetical protein
VSAAGGGAAPTAAAASAGAANGSAAATETGRSAPGMGKTLIDPSGIDLFFLQYAVSGATPPFADLAKLDTTVQSADEFSRDATLAKVEAQLRARASAVHGTSYLQVNLINSFGQYDGKYKEYDFQMVNGTTISYSGIFGREVDLTLTNGGFAETWKLDPTEAEDVLRRTGGSRSVVLVLKLEILDAPPPVNDAPLRINTRILEYEIQSQFKNVRLGKVIVSK